MFTQIYEEPLILITVKMKDRMSKQQMGKIILGIHSNIAGDNEGFTGGHAWVSVTQVGKTTAYGLWPDEHPRTIDNGAGTDIRAGLEGTKSPRASRFYTLNAAQKIKLDKGLKSIVVWRYTNTCASWASELLDDVTGVSIDADDWSGLETPREPGKHILELEKRKGPSSRISPATPKMRGTKW